MTKEASTNTMELIILTEATVHLTIVSSQNVHMTKHIIKDPFSSEFANAMKRDGKENSNGKEQNVIAVNNPKFYAKVIPTIKNHHENQILQKEEGDAALKGLMPSLSLSGQSNVDQNVHSEVKGGETTNQNVAFQVGSGQTEKLNKQELFKAKTESASDSKVLHVKNADIVLKKMGKPQKNLADSYQKEESIQDSDEVTEKLPVIVQKANNVSLKQLDIDHLCIGGEISTSNSQHTTCTPLSLSPDHEHLQDNKNFDKPTFDMKSANPDHEYIMYIQANENLDTPTSENHDHECIQANENSDTPTSENHDHECIQADENLHTPTFDPTSESQDDWSENKDNKNSDTLACELESENLNNEVERIDDKNIKWTARNRNCLKWTSIIQTRDRKSKEGSNIELIDIDLTKIQNKRRKRKTKVLPSSKKKEIFPKIENGQEFKDTFCSNRVISGTEEENIESSANLQENDFYCDVCNLKLSSLAGLQRHKTRARHIEKEKLGGKKKTYPCNICGKVFARNSGMALHRKLHSDNEKPFPCDKCGKRFQQKSTMKTHRLRHSDEYNYHCEVCPKKFHLKSDFTIHVKTHTGEKNHWCKVCNKGFLRKSNLENHMKIHTGEKTFICEYCGKGYISAHNLKTHMQVHNESESWKCNVCGKGFTQKQQLARHALIHTGEKPWICETCGFRTADKSTLSCHIRRHTGERPFKCNVCGRSFNKSSTMQRHIKCHERGGFRRRGRKVSNEVRVFTCTICNRSFAKNNRLTRHMKQVHAKKSENSNLTQTNSDSNVLRFIKTDATTSYKGTQEILLQNGESNSTNEILVQTESSNVGSKEIIDQNNLTTSEQLEITQEVQEILLREEQIIDSNTEFILVTL